jgi:uncharacterized protein YjbI with pentapeptide repeats
MIVNGYHITPGVTLITVNLQAADLAGAVLRRSWVFDARFTSEQLTWLTLSGQLSEAQAQSCVMDTV